MGTMLSMLAPYRRARGDSPEHQLVARGLSFFRLVIHWL